MQRKRAGFIVEVTEKYIESLRNGQAFSLDGFGLTDPEKEQVHETYETDLLMRILIASAKGTLDRVSSNGTPKPLAQCWSEDRVRSLIASTIDEKGYC